VRLGVYAVFCLGVTGLLLALYSSWAPIGKIRGKVKGEVERVVLADVARDVYRSGRITPEGYEVDYPPYAKEAKVFLYGKGEPVHWVESGVIPPAAGLQEAPPLALWVSPLEVTVRDGKVRFDWSPIPTGEGYPGRRRYSLLIRYYKEGGEEDERGDATLICEAPKRSISLYELEQLFQKFDVTKRELEIELRAYDPGQQKGALWVGIRRGWTFPPTTAPEPLTPMGPGGLPPTGGDPGRGGEGRRGR
tara:strand:- start:6149 stop:6892 length:744 start_codon:yes stop_codon:yes gene_type:complete